MCVCSPMTQWYAFTCDDNMFTYEDVFTCDDVFYGSVLPFVNMPAVFSLFSSELSDQLLLLPLPPVRRRLEGKRGGGGEY